MWKKNLLIYKSTRWIVLATGSWYRSIGPWPRPARPTVQATLQPIHTYYISRMHGAASKIPGHWRLWNASFGENFSDGRDDVNLFRSTSYRHPDSTSNTSIVTSPQNEAYQALNELRTFWWVMLNVDIGVKLQDAAPYTSSKVISWQVRDGHQYESWTIGSSIVHPLVPF